MLRGGGLSFFGFNRGIPKNHFCFVSGLRTTLALVLVALGRGSGTIATAHSRASADYTKTVAGTITTTTT
jgi:hypothetical protein